MKLRNSCITLVVRTDSTEFECSLRTSPNFENANASFLHSIVCPTKLFNTVPRETKQSNILVLEENTCSLKHGPAKTYKTHDKAIIV